MTENKAKNFHVNTDMFGQYAKIPTGRSGDLHIYKIITRFCSNGYCDTPIIFGKSTHHEEVTDVLNVIHCGIDESKVIRVALRDCEIIENEEAKELRQYRMIKGATIGEIAETLGEYDKIGTVEECREAVEKQKAKKPDIYTDTRNMVDLHGNVYAEQANVYLCPTCESFIGYVGNDIFHYCPVCGQAIDENLEGMEE